MSRRAPSGVPATEQGWVYTLHFDPPYPADAPPGCQQARHYTGFATDLQARLAEHAAGRGARLTQVQVAAGGAWRVASAEPGTRDRETQLKERGASRRCQICKTEAGLTRVELGERAARMQAEERAAPVAAVRWRATVAQVAAARAARLPEAGRPEPEAGG